MGNMPTELSKRNDVALRAGVSGATVSYVFSRKRYVSPELVKRVMKAAEELNYHPDMVAASMRKRSTNTIAVITGDITSPLQMEIIRAIQESAMEEGYFVHICGGVRKLESYISNVISRKVDGVFLSVDTAIVGNESIARLLDCGISVIITSMRGYSDNRVCGIELDFQEGLRLILEHLRSLGHSKIAYISCFDEDYDCDSRLPSFYRYMKEYFGDLSPRVVTGDKSYDSTIDNGYMLAKQLMRKYNDFTAVVCTNDLMALGAMRALQESGLHIPADVSVAGMDDIMFARAAYPALTTISHRSVEYGNRIFSILKKNIDDKSIVLRERIIPELIPRESTARVRQP